MVAGIWQVTGHTSVKGGGVRHNLGNTTKPDKEAPDDPKRAERHYYQVMSWGYGEEKAKVYPVGSTVLIVAEHLSISHSETGNSVYISYERAKIIQVASIGEITSIVSRWEDKQQTLTTHDDTPAVEEDIDF